MVTLFLLQCALVTGQTPVDYRPGGPPALPAPQPVPARMGDGLVGPRLSRGQEYLYRGTYNEETTGSNVQFQRSYRLESRVLVLDNSPAGAELAFLTVLRQRAAAPGNNSPEANAGSVRLETAHIDLQGKLSPPPRVSLAVPLDGPPTIECGVFVEVPHNYAGRDTMWETPDPGRPAITWRVGGNEVVNTTTCVRLVGTQQTPDWDRPRADSAAWRRTETVWIAPRLGIAYRVERVIEQREPARSAPNRRTVLRYELESSLPYPRQLFEDRRDEILRTKSFAESAAPLLAQPGKYGPQIDALLVRINNHIDKHPKTPYRDAMLQLRSCVEAAKRGESPPPKVENVPAVPGKPAVAVLGQPAPDFAATNLLTRETARLEKLLGKPVVLVFYSPTSITADDVLRFGQALQEAHRQRITVVGLAMSENVDRIKKQRDDLGLTFPILNGTGLRQTFAVETTPKVIVVDDKGIVCGSHLGWGEETPLAVMDEVRRSMPPR